MGFYWITEKQRRELDQQQREGDRLIASCNWVKIARDAELRREGLIPRQEPTQ